MIEQPLHLRRSSALGGFAEFENLFILRLPPNKDVASDLL